MILQQFLERNLLKTVEFLLKNNILNDESSTLHSSSLISYINSENKQFYSTYFFYLCDESKKFKNSIVFCSCCSSVRVFLRNHSLIKSNTSNLSLIDIIILPNAKIDPFLIYLQALVKNDLELTIQVIEQLPYFWDAHLLLIELTTSLITINSPLEIFYYAYLKILKDIDSPISLSLKDNNNFNKNISAALQYCYSNDKKALEIFKSIDFTDYFDCTFFEFYGILLYNFNDPIFPIICENMLYFHKNKYETLTMLGLFKLTQSKFNESKDLFKKAYKISNSADIGCLVSYSYIKLQEYENVSNFYQKIIKNNFRILYSIAQGYYSMNKHSICLKYCKKTLEIREDGSIYKLMGKVYQSLNNIELAIRYFEKSFKLEEYDSLLYLAEIYKNKHDISKVIELYDEYLKKGEKNIKTVAEYLLGYYEEKGDFNKMESYRSYIIDPK